MLLQCAVRHHALGKRQSHRRSVSMAITGREMTEAARQAVPKIANDHLQAQLTTGASVFVLDVREKEEWDAGHIPQATLLSRGRREGRVEELIPDKTAPIGNHRGGEGRA